MKRFPIYLVLLFLALSCNPQKANDAPSEIDSLQCVIDSFRNSDIKLSFKGLIIGDSMPFYKDQQLLANRMYLSPIDEYSYQGQVSIPYVSTEGKESTEYPRIQVDVQSGRIARVSLSFTSWNLCKFFIDTFNERYYTCDATETSTEGVYTDFYCWDFKEQDITIRRMYHKDHVHGIYNITDAVLIEYEHKTMGKILKELFSTRDSLQKEDRNKHVKQEIDNARRNI